MICNHSILTIAVALFVSAAACGFVNTVRSWESSKTWEEKTQEENCHWRETGKLVWH